MIVVHHLNNSRSQRILWLLEELRLPYEIKFYHRNAETNRAPPELKAVHPLGRSPIVSDGEKVLAESGAIIDYLLRHYGAGRLQPDTSEPSYDDFVFWMHYAESSAIQPIVLKISASRIGATTGPAMERIEQELANDLGFVDRHLQDRTFLLGEEFSGADIHMSFVGELAGRWTDRRRYQNLDSWVRRLQSRPAYAVAIQRGGVYALAE